MPSRYTAKWNDSGSVEIYDKLLDKLLDTVEFVRNEQGTGWKAKRSKKIHSRPEQVITNLHVIPAWEIRQTLKDSENEAARKFLAEPTTRV